MFFHRHQKFHDDSNSSFVRKNLAAFFGFENLVPDSISMNFFPKIFKNTNLKEIVKPDCVYLSIAG